MQYNDMHQASRSSLDLRCVERLTFGTLAKVRSCPRAIPEAAYCFLLSWISMGCQVRTLPALWLQNALEFALIIAHQT